MKTLSAWGPWAAACFGRFRTVVCIGATVSGQLLFAQGSITPGTVDSTFESHIRRGHVSAVLMQPDGRLLVCGQFGIASVGTNLVRFTADGTQDPTFAPTAGVPRDPTKLTLQSDGKVLVGNRGGVDGSYPAAGLSRFLPDGTRDQDFRFRLPTNELRRGFWSGFWTTAVTVQPDGRILLAGHYEVDYFDYWSLSGPVLQRLPPDGSQGEFFSVPSGPQYIGALLLLPDQRLLVGGDQLYRLNADGTEDAGFVRTVLPNYGFAARAGIECCITQPDGRILIGGNFTNIQGHARCRIARIMPNGQLDLSFNPPVNTREGEPYYTSVWTLALQPDGRILVGGNFETMNGLPYVALARLHSDGSLDTTFPPILPPDEDQDPVTVRSIVLQDETRALIGGERMVVSGAAEPIGLFRVHLGDSWPRLFILRTSGNIVQLTFSSPDGYDYNVLKSTNLALPIADWTVLGSPTNFSGNIYHFSDDITPSEAHAFYQLRRIAP